MPNLAENPKINHDYDILEKIDAGIVLYGFEVKAISSGKANIKGSYVKILNDELYLVNADIAPYQPKNTPKDYDSKRTRKLLVTKKELLDIKRKTNEKSLTLAPIRIYIKGRRLKLEFAIARGKKKYDKREKIKEETTRREMRNLAR